MNNLKKIFLCISIPILSLFLIILLVEIRTNKALNDYSMLPNGVKVVDKVVLGRRNRGFEDGLDKAFRRGAIELVCTNQGDVLLVMKDYKPHGAGTDEASLFISGRMENSTYKGETEIKRMKFLSSEYFDTLASDSLSETEIYSILQALKQRESDEINLSVFDGGNGFIGNAKISDVETLIDRCQKIK